MRDDKVRYYDVEKSQPLTAATLLGQMDMSVVCVIRQPHPYRERLEI